MSEAAEDYVVASCGPVHARVRPPGSKSITNRALVCAALANGASTLRGALVSEDTSVMCDSLGRLGISVESLDAGRTLRIQGCGGKIPAAQASLYVANSGTTVRFLTALVALGRGRFRLDGTPRMQQRPIADLLAALAQAGVHARSEPGTGCPPVVVDASGLRGGDAAIRGDVSSQFLSGLLLAAPYAQTPLHLHVEGQLVSQPYVTMTLAVMRAFGVEVAMEGLAEFRVPRAGYLARDYAIEPDASAASYFFAAAAISGGDITVDGLTRAALQGDVAFVDVLEQMGCTVTEGPDWLRVQAGPLRGVQVDMNAISDTVQTLGAVALFAKGPTWIDGVGHIRHKETDRLAALACELRKLGGLVEERADGLTITPGPLHGAAIDTYDDHRMAMSLALVGLRVPGVRIRDPGCVGKTYPEFWRDLEAIQG